MYSSNKILTLKCISYNANTSKTKFRIKKMEELIDVENTVDQY